MGMHKGQHNSGQIKKGQHLSVDTELKKGHKWSKEIKEKMVKRSVSAQNSGRFQKGHKAPSTAFKKDNIPWNTGMTEMKQKYPQSGFQNGHDCFLKDKTYEEIWGEEKAKTLKQVLSESKKGPKNHRYGKKCNHTKETREKIGRAHKNKPNPYAKKLSHLFKKGGHYSKETEFKKGNIPSVECTKASLKALREGKPSSLEKKWIKIFKHLNLPYKFVGDGEVMFGRKNPDFIQTNGKKIVIEVRSKAVCIHLNKLEPEEYERQRKEHFAKYGYFCDVIWGK